MIALVDTNVVLDHWIERNPHAATAGQLLTEAEFGRFEAVLCATSVTTLYFLAGRVVGKPAARNMVSMVLDFCRVAEVNARVLRAAVINPIPDLEDAVVNEAAIAAGIECIVTRDLAGFKKGNLRVFPPEEFLAELTANRNRRNGD